MDWYDKLGQFPIIQFAVAGVIGLLGIFILWRGVTAANKGGGNDTSLPVGVMYLREISETLKRIENTLDFLPSNRPGSRRR
jgi:hypothetical protein